MLTLLGRTPVLVAALLAAVVLFITIDGQRARAGGVLLDTALTAGAASEMVDSMTQTQRSSHLHTTMYYDTAFLLAYGALLTGAIWRFAQRRRIWLVMPAMLAPIFDLAENAVQVLALLGDTTFLPLKAVFTPMKFGLFTGTLIVALFLATRVLREQLLRPESRK